jgi:hypothetical protein
MEEKKQKIWLGSKLEGDLERIGEEDLKREGQGLWCCCDLCAVIPALRR